MNDDYTKPIATLAYCGRVAHVRVDRVVLAVECAFMPQLRLYVNLDEARAIASHLDDDVDIRIQFFPRKAEADVVEETTTHP